MVPWTRQWEAGGLAVRRPGTALVLEVLGDGAPCCELVPCVSRARQSGSGLINRTGRPHFPHVCSVSDTGSSFTILGLTAPSPTRSIMH